MKKQSLPGKKYTVIRYPKVDSTNSIALDLGSRDAPHGTVVLADEQSGGRGRLSRCFSSPKGGLYLSVILRPRLPIEKLSLITLAAGVACAEAVEQVSGISVQLKWPNDLYYKGEKLGGILTEAAPYSSSDRAVPFIVVGIGLNVNTRLKSFPSLLSNLATSLYCITTKEHEIDNLMDSFMSSLLTEISLLQDNEEKVMDHWRERDYLLGKKIRWHVSEGEIVHGTGNGLLSDGRYRLTSSGGDDYPVLAGDIEIINISGRHIK